MAIPAALALGLWGVGTVSAQGGCTEKELEVGIVKAKGCWTTSGTKNTTTQPVDLNGFTVTPSATAPFSIDTDSRQATTSGKKVGLAASPLPAFDPMALDFRIPSSGELPIAHVGLPPVATLAGFTLVANVETQIILTEGQGEIDLPIQFFNFFTVIGRNQSVTIKTAVIPGQGAKYDGLDIDINGLTMKAVPIGIEEFHADYSLAQDRWGGSASVVFPSASSDSGISASLAMTHGQLTDFHMGLTGLNKPIGGGVFLQKINGGFTMDPFSADLGAGVSAGPEIKIFGQEISAAAVDGNLKIQATQNTTPGFVGLSGSFALIGLPVADAGMHVYFNGVVDFNSRVGIGLPSFSNDSSQPFFIGGGFSGWFAASGFNVSGNAQLKLFATQVASAGAVISDRGLGACAQLGEGWFSVSLGFGYSFQSQSATPYFAGCDLGPYQDWNKPATRLARTGTHRGHGSLTTKHKVLRIEGADDVPGFTLTSDDGDTTIEHDAEDADGQEVEDSHMVIPNETANEAIVLLDDPAGDWTIDEAPGSEIVSVQRASVLPKEHVEAEVIGHGKRRTLVWDARGFPRQKLQFHERLGNGVIDPILFTGKASGRHRFTPQQGDFYGNRKLEVQVLQEGTPRAEKVVDNYRVTKPPVPRRPAELDVDVVRSGHDVKAQWSGSPGAQSYAVVLESSDGELRYTKVFGKGRRRASFMDTPLAKHMVVKVHALNRDDQHGRPAKRRFDF